MTSAYAEWNQRQDRIVVPFSNRVNLDDLFGNVHANVICERITPCKLALYVLIQILDELHQDVQPFTSSEHCSLLSTLYGMIEHGDMSYLEVLRVVRWMDRTVRKGIHKDFVEYIQSFLDGDDVVVQIDVLLQTRPNTVNFVYSKSYIGMWLKKLSAEWNQLSTQQIFDYNARFIEWIRDADDNDPHRMDDAEPAVSQTSVIPFEIESSGRARKWIANQMHLLQVCPSAALPDNEIMDWCQIIRKNHVDIVQVHLLEMLCHLRALNLGRAAESLRIYFDYSMFRASDLMMSSNIRGCRLGVLDQRSHRFSCLLQARLCRMFGDKKAARLLLSECVQQAQNHDMLCLRMAMVELASLEAMPPNEDDLKTSSLLENTTDSLLTTEELLRMINRAADTESRVEGEDHRDADESEQLFEQLNALAHLMTAITAARRCKAPSVIEEGLDRAMRCAAGADSGARARLISDAAVATTSSVRLRHGQALATQSLATSLVATNFPDGCAPRHETEAHVIAGVNMVYAAAMMGEWDRVTTLLGRLKLSFTPELNLQAANYVNLCDKIILFDTTILRGEWEKCTPLLEDIESLDPAEAVLRKSILLAARGELSTARCLLEEVYSKYETPSTVFVHMRLRLQMAMLNSAAYRWSAAIDMLEGVREEALAIEQKNIAGMALRRIAVVQLLSGDNESAIKSLDECQKDIYTSCSILEKAIHSIALAEAHQNSRDGQERLKILNKARAQCRQAGAILFEKYVVQEIAFFYHECGDMDERDEMAAEFAAIDDRYGGHFDWKLV
ncbi:hypothetical protein Q1695_016210 [Nippostrongylus brasiliensis]|nr:hypothetical protein Q1695_016210 [Nippostrongylus brasiliensis]